MSPTVVCPITGEGSLTACDLILPALSILQSLGEMPQLQKTLTSPADAAGFLQGSRDSGGSSKDSCDTDDFVMVPAQFPGQAHSQYFWGVGGWRIGDCQTTLGTST